MLLKLLQRIQKYNSVPVRIGNDEMTALVADTSIKRMIGLMYRKGLPKNTCMLFTFEKEKKYGIWMHGMEFGIDTLWISKELKIVHIVENMMPCTLFNCKVYKPEKPAKYVIEVNRGYIRKNNIKEGLPITIASAT